MDRSARPALSKVHGTEPMVSTALVQWMARGLSLKGLNSTELMRRLRVDEGAWRHDGGQISLQDYTGVLSGLIRELDDEALCLLARPSRPGSFALQARVAVTAKTLDEALRHVVQAFGMLHDDVRFVVEKEGSTVGVRLDFANDELRSIPHVHVHTLCAYSQLFAWLVGGRLPQVSFDFGFERQAEREGLAAMFAGELHFGMPYSAIRFDADGLRMPVCRDGDALRSFVAGGPLYHGREGGTERMSRRVLDVLMKPPLLWPDLDATARTLCMSASTLQRRLAQEGSTFQVLKDQLRRDMAVKRLRGSDDSIVKLADELGFADAASFQRAFKNWTGVPPGAYRRALG